MEKLNSSENKISSSIKLSSLTSKMLQIFVIVLSLNFTAACVVTPDGTFIDGGAGVDVDFTPQILDANNSFVTVRVGPRFYASDAYLLAYDHCLGLGMYAYEVNPWPHSASVIRDLRYDCRPNFIAPPMVYHIDRSNRYRYDYFNNYYFRTHRPNHHFRPPSTGWWGRNHYNPSHPHNYPNRPQVHQGPGYTHDGRATTPSSPRSYNPGKDRYVPRSKYDSPNYTPPVSDAPVNNKPGWWGQGSGSNVNSASSKYESPRGNSSPRYESRGNSSNNASPRSYPTQPSVDSPKPNSSPSKPSFWGKPKESGGGGSSVPPPSRGSYSKYSSSSSAPSRTYDMKSDRRESKSNGSVESLKGSKPSWMR